MPAHLRQYTIIAGAVLALLLVVWLISALLGRGGENDDDAELTAAPQATTQSQVEGSAGTEDGEQPDTATIEVTPIVPETSDLPVSRNARGDLRIGMQIQPVPGLRVALRSEPGLDTGTVTGELADGDIATIVGGPEYRQGDADTIVWWFVELPNGVQAWVAANTSEQTLLMPVP